MPLSGLDHINLRAPRELMDRLRDFYCDVVGLKVGERPPFASFGYWLYAGDQPVVHLSEARGELPSQLRGVYDHSAFRCTDRPAYEAVLKARGLDYHVVRVPLTRQVQIFCQDPAGNGVELNFLEDETAA
jgi:catechol 2,3-dioxygenase-like lactoylglutathione lyase family enzyme